MFISACQCLIVAPIPLDLITTPACRLIGVSVLQSVASAVLAPSLRHVADMLALNWRSRLTRSAFAKYLVGERTGASTCRSPSQVQQLGSRWRRGTELTCLSLPRAC